MKKFICLLFAVGLTVSACLAQNLPNVKIENEKGETITTSSLVAGTPMIVSFWSTTCKPCIMELNAINEHLDEWSQVAKFNVVAVAIDDSRSVSKARAMANGFGWDDFVLLFDKNQDFKRAMNVSTTPQSYIIDGEGRVVYSHSGYTPGREYELFQKIKELQK